MPTFVKVFLFIIFFVGFFLIWMVAVQAEFNVPNIGLLTTNENRIAWGVPLLLILISPLAYIPFSKTLDRWCENEGL
ncbi:MAG: hypothetical protein Q9M09_06165 [Mariprofundaceae bacterium]|nr:hypothetical protein [Mariprofundaceae bacterium]